MDASGSIIVAKQGNEVAMRLRSGAAHAAESFGTLSQVARIGLVLDPLLMIEAAHWLSVCT